MSVIQDKVLNFIFCEPNIEGLWDRLMTHNLSEDDVIWELFEDRDDLKEIAIGLEREFKDIFDLGYQQALKNK